MAKKLYRNKSRIVQIIYIDGNSRKVVPGGTVEGEPSQMEKMYDTFEDATLNDVEVVDGIIQTIPKKVNKKV